MISQDSSHNRVEFQVTKVQLEFNHGRRFVVAPSSNGVRGITPKIFFGKFYAKPCILGNICAIISPPNWSILLCLKLVLRLALLNRFSY